MVEPLYRGKRLKRGSRDFQSSLNEKKQKVEDHQHWTMSRKDKKDKELQARMAGKKTIIWSYLPQWLVDCLTTFRCETPDSFFFYKHQIFSLLNSFFLPEPEKLGDGRDLGRPAGRPLQCKTFACAFCNKICFYIYIYRYIKKLNKTTTFFFVSKSSGSNLAWFSRSQKNSPQWKKKKTKTQMCLTDTQVCTWSVPTGQTGADPLAERRPWPLTSRSSAVTPTPPTPTPEKHFKRGTERTKSRKPLIQCN